MILLDCRVQTATAMYTQAPVLYDAAAERENRLLSSPEDSPPGPDDDASSESEAEWRVRVTVMRFQEDSVSTILWAARHEDVATFMTRASFLLCPLDGSQQLVCVEPQPDPDSLHLICCPTWWQSEAIHAFLLRWPDTPASWFVDAAKPDSLLSDLIPQISLGEADNVDVYTSARRPPTRLDEPFQPHIGAIVDIRTPGNQTEHMPSARSIIANRTACARGVDRRNVATNGASHVLIIDGVGRHRALPWHDEIADERVAAAANIPATDLQLCWMRAPFSGVTFHGRKIVGFCSARQASHFPHARRQRILFVDARHLGLPICCVSFPHLTIDAAEMCAVLGIRVPEG